ncbi:ankyrin repeat domain-containing protein [Paenibacillus sp. LHD-117]|uniref:ankyrin repeat domain-containing protein n=1 Tax=Paenibacillus sp. LHD-117 TaxID=3071412 RepID=UPI0027E14399|nr:ankyrin repeat domain-containing protein [Paenibacillus sp. LHD-117]MDQ6419631.1 ankyrin repeat domain-containing protein [Paenibacillus sp. LHD-117]
MNEINRDSFDSIDGQNKIAMEQFIQTVQAGDVETTAQLLQSHPLLARRIDEPWFSFDSPAIVVAASRGNREMVDLLLENVADINAKSSWWAGGFGVLHHNHHDLAHYLIERGARVDPHAAAALGMLDTLEKMAEEDPSFANQRGPDGQVPLHFATSHEIIDFLLAHGADIDRRDVDHGSTPAQWSVDNPDKCNYLIKRGAQTDIFMAIMLGDVEQVRRILESDPGSVHAQIGKGDFTSGSSDGGHIYEYIIGRAFRPLYLAACLKHADITELMLNYASVEERFLLACGGADRAAVHHIIRTHPNMVQSLQPEDQGLIADAAWDNRVEAVRLMLEVGFDVNASSQSFTALHRAAIRGNVELVQLLLEQGASVHLLNEYGGSPLGSCIWGSLHCEDPRGNYPAVAESLIRAGSDLPEHAAGKDEVKNVLIGHGVAR